MIKHERSARADEARVAEHAITQELRPRLVLEVIREAQRVLRTRDARFAKRCERDCRARRHNLDVVGSSHYLMECVHLPGNQPKG